MEEGENSEVSSFLRSQGFRGDRTLGSGSYSNVRVAWSEKLKTNVALKVIDKRRAKKDYLTKFFDREREIILKLKHPHIVNFLEVLSRGFLAVFVSEYAEGGDLLEKIKERKRLPEDDARFLYRQLLEAVSYIHARNLVHRDIKCENIFLDKHENIKLGDFGFTRLMRPGDVSNTFCGSRAYAPPEITMGRSYSDAASVDLWSLGVVLYIMVTGFMPYDERDVRKMLDKQLEHRIGYASSIKDSIGQDVKDLISQLCDPRPRMRPRCPDILQSPWLRNLPWMMYGSRGKLLRVNPTPRTKRPLPVPNN